jgi:hypothetical protein
MGFQRPTRLRIAGKPSHPIAGTQTRLGPSFCSWLRTTRRVLKNARRDSQIAKTFDGDFGLLARYLANPRAAGHAAVNLETQSLGGCLGIGRNGKVDKFGHM